MRWQFASMAIFLLMTAGQGIAEPNKTQYELEERCGKEARALFEKDWKGQPINKTDDGQIIASFENHYNPELNKCYYLQIATTYIINKKPQSTIVSFILLDLNDNRELGHLLQVSGEEPTFCVVGERACHSKAEWQDLIRRYMER